SESPAEKSVGTNLALQSISWLTAVKRIIAQSEERRLTIRPGAPCLPNVTPPGRCSLRRVGGRPAGRAGGRCATLRARAQPGFTSIGALMSRLPAALCLPALCLATLFGVASAA